MTAIWLIARRELHGYLLSPLGYVIIAAILLIDGILFNGFAMGGETRAPHRTDDPRKSLLGLFLLCDRCLLGTCRQAEPDFCGRRDGGEQCLRRVQFPSSLARGNRGR